jgi:hypothetical protein
VYGARTCNNAAASCLSRYLNRTGREEQILYHDTACTAIQHNLYSKGQSVVSWDRALCCPYMNQGFRGKHRLHLQSGNQPSKKPTCSRWLDRFTCGLQSALSWRWQHSKLLLWELQILYSMLRLDQKTSKLRGLYSASELYRLSDRHLSAKFSANFCGKRGVAWSARRNPHGR